jgi:molecular chaperone GrpE
MVDKAQSSSASWRIKAQIEDLTNKWKRALADYQNLEKRVKSEKEEFGNYANRELILKLLPVLDTFEKLEEHLKDEGLALALRQFRDILTQEGLEKIEVLGKEFNPQEMECVEVEEGKEENRVTEEVRAGYRLKGKVLRVAQVAVGKRKIEEKAEELAKEQLAKGDYM